MARNAFKGCRNMRLGHLCSEYTCTDGLTIELPCMTFQYKKEKIEDDWGDLCTPEEESMIYPSNGVRLANRDGNQRLLCVTETMFDRRMA